MNDRRDANPLDALRSAVSDRERLDPSAADRIEARLRVAHAEHHTSVARPWPRWLIAGPVVIAIVLTLTLTLVLRGSDPAQALVVTDADNVTVILPDGTVLTDPDDGYALPDGARVEIGAGGMVTVDEVVLDTAGVLEVRDGRLVADVVATTTAPALPDHLDPVPAPATPEETTTTASPTTSAPPTTTVPEPVPEPTPTRVDEPQPEPEPTRRDDERREPGRDDPEGRDRDDGRGEPEDPESAEVDRPTDEERSVTVGITLELARIDDGIRVAWNVEGLQSDWTVVVVRMIGDGPATAVVTTSDPNGEITDRPTRDNGRSDERRVHYRVSVVDNAGGEVASGPTQSLR